MKNFFFKRRIREVSALSLSAILALLIWLIPGFNPPDNMGGQGLMNMLVAIFVILLIYLTVQAYPIIKKDIGSPMDQNLDSMVSTLPGIVSIFGILTSLMGFWPLSPFWLIINFLVILVVVFDLVIIGGAAAKILYLTDETMLTK